MFFFVVRMISVIDIKIFFCIFNLFVLFECGGCVSGESIKDVCDL